VDIRDSKTDIVEAVQDTRPRRKVIRPLGEKEIPDMENGRPCPRIHSEYPEQNVVRFKGVWIRDALGKVLNPAIVAVEIEEGEEDRAGFLDACESEEGPFPVELVEGEVVMAELGCYLALAGVVAFWGAIPEEEAEVQWEGTTEGLRGIRCGAVRCDAALC
jgi:hypothetical protein